MADDDATWTDGEEGPVVWAGLADAVASASQPADTDIDVDLAKVGKVAEGVVVSAVLATSLASALSEPPRSDLMSLPDPTPIVRTLESFEDEEPPVPDDDDDDEASRRRERLLRLLRLLALAIFLALSLAFGALKGCASCAATFVAPVPEEQEAFDDEAEEGAEEGSAETTEAAEVAES